MATNNPQSVHALVRLLKSPTDPPSIPGPSKIEIARLAWSEPSFRATNKGEVIGEWILTLLGQAKKTRREKDTNHPIDPIADSRYWTLLGAVLTTRPSTAARPIKTWLLPLLNRLQMDVIVIELLAFQSSEALASARAALTVLWPLAEKKIAVDALTECLGAVFNACVDWERVDDALAWICSAVVATYRNALANAGNKKKVSVSSSAVGQFGQTMAYCDLATEFVFQIYNSFLSTHLSSWLCVISPVGPSSTKQLQDSIYAAGTDTLLSLDALKQPLDTLFDALSSSIPSSLLVLPNLCASFLSATHKHRSALFVSAVTHIDGREEVRRKGMEFVEKCWILIRGSTSPREDGETDKWKSAIGVLRIVEKERLFVARPIHGVQTDAVKVESGGKLALTQVRDKAVEMLEIVDTSSNDPREGQVVPYIQLLDVLIQIEYDFVGSVLERVLSALINIPPSLSRLAATTSSEFLTHVLEYHTKTRTVHTYVLALLSAAAASPSASTSATPTSRSMAFPLTCHLPALARALRTSLTPNQITPLATAVLQAIESIWGAFRTADEGGERSAKKRKVGEDAIESGRAAESVAVQARAFTRASRVAGSVLSSLPASAYTKDEACSLGHLWGDVGKLGWTIVWDCLREKIGKARDATKGQDGKKRKQAVERDPSFPGYPHTAASAALQFLYDVRARVSFPLGEHDWLEEAQVETLLGVARDKESDPELVLEIVRTLLWHIWCAHDCKSEKQMETQPIFTMILNILNACPLSNLKWSGISAALTRNNLGLAVLCVLTERWIDVLDALTSTEFLERLISPLLTASLDPSDEDTQDNSVITLRSITFGLLRNAQFWELHNIRGVFLSSVLTVTAPLSPYCLPIAGAELPSPISATELTPVCNVYGLLHYVPPEYFTRPVRTELVKRAIAADVQICLQLESAQGHRPLARKGKDKNNARHRKSHAEELDDRVTAESLRWSRRLTFVRVFLHRMDQFMGTPSHSASLTLVNHLLDSPSSLFPSETLTSVTLDLVQLHILNLLRSQELEAAASASRIISTLVTTRPFSQPKSQETWTQLIVQSSILKLIERTTSDLDASGVPDQVKRALKSLLEALESVLSPHADRFAENDAREAYQFLSSEQINAWSRMLSLRRWLGLNSRLVASSFGLKLAASTICSESSVRLDSETCSSVFGLLIEELWCMSDASHRVHLDVLVGFYAINGGNRTSDMERMDAYVAQASKKMSVEDFSYLLDVLEAGIGGSGLRVGHIERLIHLGQTMLHDAPQGTLKVIQNFATRCFDLFTNRENIYGGSSCLKFKCLEFIAKHCSDRPAAIRSIDLGSIWSLLYKMLSGSSEHDATTVFAIFHHIVTIIGALIRLRRDLIVHTLPHLGLVLRQLMMLIRKIRPQLGAKQRKIVTDTFPSWLSASVPLSTDEARALARLLVSLTTKTVPRTHAYASAESHKAESLAKPFAKHASYVLVAYVDAFNDPLCIVNVEMRRDLEPGLFALCEMVGEHSRDALMLSALDSGGKTIMKSLWKEYEKQRYVGKG